MRDFKIGDRVGISDPDLLAQLADSPNPTYGHVVNVGGQSLVWVRDSLGGEWGVLPHQLNHID